MLMLVLGLVLEDFNNEYNCLFFRRFLFLDFNSIIFII